MTIFRRLLKSSKGATAIEYGLIVALIALGIVGAAIILGTTISDTLQGASDGFTP